MIDMIELIKKMLTKGLNAAERARLSEEKPMEELLLQQWDENSDRHIQEKVDPKSIWENIAIACWGRDEKAKSNHRKSSHLLKMAYVTVAAAAVLLFGVWVSDVLMNSSVIIKAPVDRRIALVLPDSSSVWLNAGGTLRYRKNFAKERNIELNGEAYFDVVKKFDSPFKVLFGKASVEVKGTEFSIKSNENLAEITLFTGKILFSIPALKNGIEMNPYDQIVYNTSNQTVKMTTVDTAEYDWRSSEYKFVDKPLCDLIQFLNRIYKVKIIIKNQADLTVPFIGTIRKDEKLSDVLNKICISFDMQQMQQGDSIILY